MTPPATLPSPEDIQLAIKEITETTGTPPAVFALARHLGIANTTFRRRFPDIASQLRQQRTADSPHGHAANSRLDQLERDNAQLRHEKQNLAEHLELAIANILRLTLENNQLRQELENATRVHQIATHRHRVNTPEHRQEDGQRSAPNTVHNVVDQKCGASGSSRNR